MIHSCKCLSSLRIYGVLLGFLLKGFEIFAFCLKLPFNVFILCYVFCTETLISFPCTNRKSRVLQSSGKGYALNSFLRNQSCNVLCTPSVYSQWHSAKLCSHLSCWSCRGRASTGLRTMSWKTWKLPRGISDCENCLSKGFLLSPTSITNLLLSACPSVWYYWKLCCFLKFHILIEVVYTDISAHWYFSSNLAESAY